MGRTQLSVVEQRAVVPRSCGELHDGAPGAEVHVRERRHLAGRVAHVVGVPAAQLAVAVIPPAPGKPARRGRQREQRRHAQEQPQQSLCVACAGWRRGAPHASERQERAGVLTSCAHCRDRARLRDRARRDHRAARRGAGVQPRNDVHPCREHQQHERWSCTHSANCTGAGARHGCQQGRAALEGRGRLWANTTGGTRDADPVSNRPC